MASKIIDIFYQCKHFVEYNFILKTDIKSNYKSKTMQQQIKKQNIDIDGK